MQFVMLIYQPPAFDPKQLPPEEQQQIGAEYGAISATLNVTPGLPLGFVKDATTVQVVGTSTVSRDGPYVDAARAVGGYFVFDAETKEEAIALAARVPAARLGGAVEIRPADVYW